MVREVGVSVVIARRISHIRGRVWRGGGGFIGQQMK